jgi:ribosomal protein L7/L12
LSVELDDYGFPPNEIRQKIIDEEGEWELIIDPAKLKNKAEALKVLRQALNLSIEEISKLFKNMPNIISGTKIEIQWLRQLLSNKGIESSIERKVRSTLL